MTFMPQQQDNKDIYASRISDTPAMTKRSAPVAHGKKEAGALTISQLDAYEKNGFLFFDSLFSQPEIDTLLQEVERLKTSPELDGSDYVIREPQSRTIRSFFYVHQFNPLFKALSRDTRLVAIAEQILGSQVYLHQSRVNLKPGFYGRDFYWHSDFETWHTEDGMPDMRALSCYIALTDNNAHNGPLMLIPGSHQHYISCVGKTPENHYKQSLRKQEYGVPDNQLLTELVDRYGIVAPTGKAGSVTFFDCNLMHGSNSNITPYPRSNVFFVYNSVHNTLAEPFGDTKPRPEHIVTRKDCRPIITHDLT